MLFCLGWMRASFQETIDRIIAVVNEEVITLTDLRIAQAFGLFEDRAEEPNRLSFSDILERLINQKLVIQLSAEKASVNVQELDAYEKRLQERRGEEKIKEAFQEFGLDWSGLREYIRERLLFESLISRKFGQTVVISLDEMEDFYRNRYVPSQREKGLEPKPMMEVLKEIESTIREKKIKNQVQEWIRNLKKQADIHIRVKDLEKSLNP